MNKLDHQNRIYFIKNFIEHLKQKKKKKIGENWQELRALRV